MMEIKYHIKNCDERSVPSGNSGFGQVFTSHMFTATYTEPQGWHNAQICPYGPLSVDPASRALNFGLTLIEGMKAYKQRDGHIAIFRPEFHYERMYSGAMHMRLPTVPQKLFLSAINGLLKTDEAWVPPHRVGAIYIRPVLMASEPAFMIRPPQQALFYVILCLLNSIYDRNLKIRVLVADRVSRTACGGIGAVKTAANYANSLSLEAKARESGYDQILWLNQDHSEIEELSFMNVFFVFRNEIVTPAPNGNILKGCTRDSAIRLLAERHIQVVERKIDIHEVLARHKNGDLLEIFGTGTAMSIVEIAEITYGLERFGVSDTSYSGVAAQLTKDLTDIQNGDSENTFGWLRS